MTSRSRTSEAPPRTDEAWLGAVRLPSSLTPAVLLALLVAAPGAHGATSEDVITDEELARLLEDLGRADFEARWSAAERILDLGKENAEVVARGLDRSVTATPEHMRLVLTGLRKTLKEDMIKDLESRGKQVPIKDLPVEDPLAFLRILVQKQNKNYPAGWRDAVEIMVLLDALASMSTTESIGHVIDYAPRHEAAFRKEIYQIVRWLGPSAVPALIRRQNAKDQDVLIVVSAALADLKMERPGQQVQLKDHALLVEVLQAFGEHKDLDALDAVASFIDSDKDQVREAARNAILDYGQLALWTLKAEYKESTGRMPDPEWDAARIAKELFTLQDTERMAPLDDRMKQGLELARSGKLEDMEKAYRRILAEQPFYGRRSEMVPGYMAFGWDLLEAGDLERAALMFKVAQRLDEEGRNAKAIEARLLLVEGLESIEQGAPDAHPLVKAVELDPDLDMARDKLEEVESYDRKRRIGRYRILGALGIASAALIVLAILVIRRLDRS